MRAALLIGMKRLSKRKAEVARFLRAILENPKTTTLQRLRAVERLDDLYRRHDEEQQRAAERAARSAEAAPTATAPTPETEQPVSPADALREAQAFLERTRQKEAAVNAAR